MFRILSVDNNVTRANLTARAVRDLKFGIRMNYALSATQAILYIAGTRTARKVLPDMILLSAHLPDTTAHDALCTIRDAVAGHSIPIISIADEKQSHSAAGYYKHGACALVRRGSDVEDYMKSLGETVTFVAMVEGLIPKQPHFFPDERPSEPSIKDVLQIHL